MDLKILLLTFLLISSCVPNTNKGKGLEQDIAFNIVQNSLIFKEFELRCDSISKINQISNDVQMSIVKKPFNKEDSINNWQTVFLECTNKIDHETIFTIKVDTINKKIAKSLLGLVL
jgi:hypothetical protein